MKKRFFTLAATFLLGGAMNANATALTIDTGWVFGQFVTGSNPGDISADGPWDFTLSDQAWFRLTDPDFKPTTPPSGAGDVYSAIDTGIGTLFQTASFAGSPFGDSGALGVFADAGWSNLNFTSGEILLDPGSYSVNVRLDQFGNDCCSAAFALRLDSLDPGVPEPTTVTLLAFGLFGVGAASRIARSRRKVD